MDVPSTLAWQSLAPDVISSSEPLLGGIDESKCNHNDRHSKDFAIDEVI